MVLPALFVWLCSSWLIEGLVCVCVWVVCSKACWCTCALRVGLAFLHFLLFPAGKVAGHHLALACSVGDLPSCPRGHFSDREPTTPTRRCRWWTSTSLWSRLAHPLGPLTFMLQGVGKQAFLLQRKTPPGPGFGQSGLTTIFGGCGTRVSPHSLMPEPSLDCSQAGCPTCLCAPE